MDNRAIAVFDSGLGGLTSLDVLTKLLPNEDYIYFGDSGRMPYGDKPRDAITAMSRQLLEFVLSFEVKAVLVACGTITSACLPELCALSPVPVLGVVEPAARAAAEKTKNGRVGVIATAATVSSGAYQSAIRALLPGCQIFARGCPALAPMVESGRFSPDDGFVLDTVRSCVRELLDNGIDTLLLGCTHYYLLNGALQKVCGKNVSLVQNGGEAALELVRFLTKRDALSPAGGTGSQRFFTSGDREVFAAGAGMFLGRDILEKTRQTAPFTL